MRNALMVIGGALIVSACSAGPAQQAAPQATAYKPVVTLNEIMVNIVDPHSHELWDASASSAKAPQTDEEWRNIRHAAITLAAAGSLTMVSGNGPKDQVWRDQKDWAALSQAISDAGMAASLAVQNRNVAALSKAGDQLLQACLTCHKAYKELIPPISADPEIHKPEFQ
jgi:cytochrome c556